MKRILSIILCSAMAVLVGKVAWAQPYGIELDVDGVLGDGTDFVAANISDQIEIDIWVTGSGPNLKVVGVVLCWPLGCVNFVSGVCLAPQPLICGLVIYYPWANCVAFQTLDLFGPGAPPPFLLGHLSLHAGVDHCLEVIALDPSSGWSNVAGGTGDFAPYDGVDIQIGSTATEESSWGSIKSLFR